MGQIDDYSPIVQGDTLKPLIPYFETFDESGNRVPYDFGSYTISLIMVDEAGNAKAGLGTWTVIDSALGLASYAWNAADVGTAGTWTLYFVFTDSISGKYQHSLTKILEITPAPVIS